MISHEQYITLVKAMNITNNIEKAATIAGMHRNTASKMLKNGKVPKNKRKKQVASIKSQIIEEKHWHELASILKVSPELEATAGMDYLLNKYPDHYTGKEIRSLQRKFRDWRIEFGADQEVMFSQIYHPGERSQSDFIHMDYLKITISGQQYNHLLFHYVLAYSGWEDVLVCTGGESFYNLSSGYERAVWKLGGLTKTHRTDNLSAAITRTAKGNHFTDSWNKLMSHYAVEPTVNNPGKSNENGKVERSNGLLKRSLENQLKLRGSKDFVSFEAYQNFIDNIVKKRNAQRKEKVSEDIAALRPLPTSAWYSAIKLPVKVHTDSTIRLEGATYSVPSRSIGYTLFAYVYPDKIELFYGNKQIAVMPRLKKGEVSINFIHILNSLRRKPGAFEDYKYKDYMYPTIAFRKSYDLLKAEFTLAKANKSYIELLYLAKMYSVTDVATVLKAFISKGLLPLHGEVKRYLIKAVAIPDIIVKKPNLVEYNELLSEVER